AGATLSVEAYGPDAPVRYYDVAGALTRRADQAVCPAAEARTRLSAALHDSVRHHLVADVPVAVFLSAGLDSGALLGTMAELGARDTVAITLAFSAFRGADNDEAPLAAQVAARYGAAHAAR